MSQTAVIGHLAESFVIEGGRPLYGRIQAAGNKNGALPILAGGLLTSEPVVLRNVPRIADVETMIELLSDIGADADWTGPNELQVHAAEIAKQELDEELCSRMRASFLLAGPLLARFGSVSAAPPGGDVIGRRRLDPHIHAFAELGAHVEIGRRYEMRGGALRGKPIFLDEASVMATENAVMAATLTPGETVLGNAACEPHVQDLCRFLVSLGARIDGIESNVLRIGGVRVPPRQELVIQDDLGGHVPKIEDGPWPAFPSDLTSVALTVATQAAGTILMFEKMFENRLFFTDKLVSMGARIILCDPHRAVVTGPAKLRGQRMESPDIRAGMAMLLASLCAEGSSTIGADYQIEKG